MTYFLALRDFLWVPRESRVTAEEWEGPDGRSIMDMIIGI